MPPNRRARSRCRAVPYDPCERCDGQTGRFERHEGEVGFSRSSAAAEANAEAIVSAPRADDDGFLDPADPGLVTWASEEEVDAEWKVEDGVLMVEGEEDQEDEAMESSASKAEWESGGETTDDDAAYSVYSDSD